MESVSAICVAFKVTRRDAAFREDCPDLRGVCCVAFVGRHCYGECEALGADMEG